MTSVLDVPSSDPDCGDDPQPLKSADVVSNRKTRRMGQTINQA